MDQQNEAQQKPIPQNLSAFGRNYVFIGVFTDKDELKKTVSNWHNAKHSTMVKKGNRLYASQFRTKNY